MVRTTRRRFVASVAAAAAFPLAAGRAFAAAGEPRRFGLGLVTYNVAKDWDLPTVLRVCGEVGIAAVELRTTHAHKVEPSLAAAERDEVKRRFADSGVRFWGCGSTCEFHDPDPAVVRRNVEECKRFIDFVADLGGTGVKVRPNGLPPGVPVEKTVDQIGAALVECGRAAEAAGVEVWVEVHGGGTQEPAVMRAILDRCDHPAVGVTWNSNGTDVKDGSVAEAFALLSPRLRSCHINDLGNDATGAYPYRELFGLLRDAGYDRYTLIEVGTPYRDAAAGETFLREYKALWERLSA